MTDALCFYCKANRTLTVKEVDTMTETTDTTQVDRLTVKQYRDDIRAALAVAYKATKPYTPVVGEVTSQIKDRLQGKQGFTKDEQVAALTATLAEYEAAVDAVDAITPEAIIAQMEESKAVAKAALTAAADATVKAIALAQERDFDAYLAEKNAAKYSYADTYVNFDDDEDDEEDEES